MDHQLGRSKELGQRQLVSAGCFLEAGHNAFRRVVRSLRRLEIAGRLTVLYHHEVGEGPSHIDADLEHGHLLLILFLLPMGQKLSPFRYQRGSQTGNHRP